MEKGPLIAGFRVFSSRISIVDLFSRYDWIRCQKGPDPVSEGSGSGQKGPEHCPSEAPEALWPLATGYLDLSNTYPRWPWAGSGYRAQMAEDTGTEGQLRCPVHLPPVGYWPVEPRRPLRHRGRTGR